MAEPAINVIVPLGGLGSRFQKEGYLTRTKPFCPVLGKEMILWVLESLTLKEGDALVIVYNPSYMSIGNFMHEIVGERYPDCKFVELPGPTRGAAETVLVGLKGIDESIRGRPTLLADGDTFYTSDIVGAFRAVASTHNAVFCFNDTQEKPIYSYIKIDDKDDITEVKEKVKISDWANSGCYCFKDGSVLAKECEALIEANSTQASQDGVGEFYTSGVIATMLSKKEPFRALKLDVADIHVLGTPAQVAEFCAKWPKQPRQRFLFDLEGVFIVGFKGTPIQRNIEHAQRLKQQGHIIIIQSTRPYGQEKKTKAFLEELKIPCDELYLGKPRADFCIGGPRTVDSTLVDLDKTLGFYPTEVKTTKPDRAPRQPPPKKKAKVVPVKNIKPDSKGLNCLVKIVSDFTEVQVKSTTFFEATCGDASGQVTLSVTSAQKDGLAKDKVIFVRNGHVKMVGGRIRLVIDKWGKLDADTGDETVEEVGTTDMSAIEYELVN